MKRITAILFVLTLIVSCSGTKNTQNAIENGDYDSAFSIAVEKLTKDKKKYEKQVPLLKEAFDKANARDLARLKQLKKQKPQNLQEIYNAYMNMDVRQDEIILLEPLYFEGKKVNFTKTDYTRVIATAKKKYADELYNKASSLINGSKLDARKAVAILEDSLYLSLNYRDDLENLVERAKKKGSDFIYIKLHNNIANQLSDSIILLALEGLSNKRSYSNENRWYVLHSKKDNSVNYNYQVDVYLNKYTLFPLQEQKKIIKQKKQIQTGWVYQRDVKGAIKTYRDGTKIKTPKKGTVHATLTLHTQSKTGVLEGEVSVKKINNNVDTTRDPIIGKIKFVSEFATYKGDFKAIDKKYYKTLNNKNRQLPPNKMFKELALENFMLKVEQFLGNYKF